MVPTSTLTTFDIFLYSSDTSCAIMALRGAGTDVELHNTLKNNRGSSYNVLAYSRNPFSKLGEGIKTLE